MKIEVIINAAEEGGYWAQATHIPGCITEGDTIEELMTNLCEAIDGCMEVLSDDARTKGSHRIFIKDGDTSNPISVPVHGNKALKIGTQKAIMKAAGIDESEL